MTRRWSDEDTSLLKSLVESGSTLSQISSELGRTKRAVQFRMRLLGIRILVCKRRFGRHRKWQVAKQWSRAEDFKLMTYASNGITQAKAAQLLNRTLYSITERVQTLGICWRRGYMSAWKLADMLQVSHGTVTNHIQRIYGSISKGQKTGRRYMLDDAKTYNVARSIMAKMKLEEFKIKDAKWGKVVNIAVLICPKCGTECEHRLDRWIVKCVCGTRGYVEGKPPLDHST